MKKQLAKKKSELNIGQNVSYWLKKTMQLHFFQQIFMTMGGSYVQLWWIYG